MLKNYVRQMALATGLLLTMTASAIELPYAKAPADGSTYILTSRLKPASYFTRTSWDGALYLQPYNLDNATKAAVTARKNDDGTWSFFRQSTIVYEEDFEETVTEYMGIPSGTDNLNIKLTEPAFWTVEESDVQGYYLLKAGEGQGNEMTVGGYLHLNAGGEYLVISEQTYGGGWYPDYYGGVEKDEYDEPALDDSGFVIPLNPISRYWAFVELSDVPAFSLKVQLYALLQDIENNYLADEDYKAGFQGAIDAALPYYQKEEFTAEDLNAAKAIVDAKNALYKEILNAKELLGTETDAVFAAAIAVATTAFNTQNGADALAQALETLKQAEVDFAKKGDDMTALGTNMSFEDLSAQNGTQTSSVAGAPAGWNVYVRGQQVTTADEVRAAGITAWHGANNDAEGEPMDGDVAFGLWTSGVPEYEISQTISGLETGSYTITAGLMVGANGNGSRRTTQRIFGNLNATYFASQEEYDEALLDQGEVYGFANLEEPVTDRLLQPISVRAFVYDGTLTFGLRTNGNIAAALRETGNGAGGDGWFKLDNFRIMKEGYLQEDALAVYEHFSQLYENLRGQDMQKTVKEELNALLSGNIGVGSSQEEIIAAINSLKGIYDKVQSSVDAYKKLSDAIDEGTNTLIEYEHSASADEFGDLLMDAEAMLSDAVAGEAEIDAMIAQIEAGKEQLKATAIVVGDITFVLKNPSFEDLSNQNNTVSDGAQPAPAGWTLKADGEVVETIAGGWCAINRGDAIDVTDDEGNYYDHQYTDGEYLWGVWNGTIPEIELSQTLKNLPVGNYTLKADVMVQYNWAGDCLTTQRLFANNYIQMFGSESGHALNLPEDAKHANLLTYAGYDCASDDPTTSLLRPMEVNFDVDTTGIAVIGFRTNNIDRDSVAQGSGKGWFKLDNFRLFYNSEQVSEGIVGTKKGNAAVLTQYYGLDGRRRQALRKGVNIVRYTDSEGHNKTVKVVVD